MKLKALISMLVLCLFIIVSCSEDKTTNSDGDNQDGNLIEAMIQTWKTAQYEGNFSALEALFDPNCWDGSSTETELGDFFGSSSALEIIDIIVYENTATAFFKISFQGIIPLFINWYLEKQEDNWKIKFDVWGSENNPDVSYIHKMVDYWESHFRHSNYSNIQELFDITYWDSSKTNLNWNNYNGMDPDIEDDDDISISGNSAQIIFQSDEGAQLNITVQWNLQRQDIFWKIVQEEWTFN